MAKHQEDSLLKSRICPRVGMLGIRLECGVVGSEGIGCCDIAQASGRRSRLDCERLRGGGICSESVTSGNVANPIQVPNAWREVKFEEVIKPIIRWIQVHVVIELVGNVVVNEHRFALHD